MEVAPLTERGSSAFDQMWKRPNLEVASLAPSLLLPSSVSQVASVSPSSKCVPVDISGGVDIFKVPGCQLLGQVSSQSGLQKVF